MKTIQEIHEMTETPKVQYLPNMLSLEDNIDGIIMEFGVFKGDSINQIATHFSSKEIHGFDSFHGLPEPWIKQKTGAIQNKSFSLNGILPNVKDNVILYPGWFEDTIPLWKDNHTGPISILHVDCDIYSSTKTILTMLNDQIVENTLILFDDMYHWIASEKYSNWDEHEWKALHEWCDEFDRDYNAIARARQKQKCILLTVW